MKVQNRPRRLAGEIIVMSYYKLKHVDIETHSNNCGLLTCIGHTLTMFPVTRTAVNCVYTVGLYPALII